MHLTPAPPTSSRAETPEVGTPLSPARDAQARLALAARNGDRGSRNVMILRNRRLALSLARRYQGRGVPREDLEQEALLGLIIAVDRFDPARGTAFSTYATFWIRQKLQRAVERTSPLTHLPGRRKTANAPAELPPPSRPTVVSLNAPARAGGDTPLGELVPDPLSLAGDPLDRLVCELATEATNRIMEFLPEVLACSGGIVHLLS